MQSLYAPVHSCPGHTTNNCDYKGDLFVSFKKNS